jgi:hypothetical protein
MLLNRVYNLATSLDLSLLKLHPKYARSALMVGTHPTKRPPCICVVFMQVVNIILRSLLEVERKMS